MEEERRLAFVALTRAEKKLHISEADGRNFDGSPRYPSHLILDINQRMLHFTQEPQEGLIREAKGYIESSQKYLPEDDSSIIFQIGQCVTHTIFGAGTILDVDMEKSAHVVEFDEMEAARDISFRAKLDRV